MEPERAAASRLRLTPRDLELLAFAAEHRLVLSEQIAALLHTSVDAARARLRALSRAGVLSGEQPFQRQAACYQIRQRGLDAIGSDLRPPKRLDLRTYDHEAGAAWLWLAAGHGSFGALSEVLGERRLRSVDARPGRVDGPYGVRLGGLGPHGRERLHYPDLLLIAPDGRRIALELELSSKGRVRREKILAGYAADARIDAVLYLVRDRRIGRAIQQSARRLGIGELIHLQEARLPAVTGRASSSRAAARAGGHDRHAGAQADR